MNDLEEAVKFLKLKCTANDIMTSHSRGELYFVPDYIHIHEILKKLPLDQQDKEISFINDIERQMLEQVTGNKNVVYQYLIQECRKIRTGER